VRTGVGENVNVRYTGDAVAMVPGRLRGYREWSIRERADGDLVLVSVTAGTVWPWTPVHEARCHRQRMAANPRLSFAPLEREHDPDDVPAKDCSCGIYARHDPHHIVGREPVAGVIEAWGRIEIGRHGFRARYARLVAIAVCPLANGYRPMAPWWIPATEKDDYTCNAARRLSERYQVPAYLDLRRMIDAFPPVDVGLLTGQRTEARQSASDTSGPARGIWRFPWQARRRTRC
jgi:hypothetical protein